MAQADRLARPAVVRASLSSAIQTERYLNRMRSQLNATASRMRRNEARPKEKTDREQATAPNSFSWFAHKRTSCLYIVIGQLNGDDNLMRWLPSIGPPVHSSALDSSFGRFFRFFLILIVLDDFLVILMALSILFWFFADDSYDSLLFGLLLGFTA